MDLRREVRLALATGKTHLGLKETKKHIEDAKLIITATNCPETFDRNVHRYKGTNFELGALCGKPFPVSVVVITDPGESNILALLKE